MRRARPTAAAPIRKPRTTPKQPTEIGEVERLQKVLADAGIGSRRACEELIAAGRVPVDGAIAELGDKVDPINAEIYVDGERVITDSRLVYLAMNKPRGVVSTMADEKGREALADFLGDVPQRVYHVGRLDAESEGLLLLTNDGTLAHRLMHPSYGVPKTYLAEVAGPIRSGLRQQLVEGVELEDGPVRADAFRVVDSLGKRVLVEIVLHEGRKHIVRRMLDEVGYPVSRLVRTSIGPIKIGDLRAGRTRRLTRAEVAALFKAVEDEAAEDSKLSVNETGSSPTDRAATMITMTRHDGGRAGRAPALGRAIEVEARVSAQDSDADAAWWRSTVRPGRASRPCPARLASALDARYLDTGAMYRAVDLGRAARRGRPARRRQDREGRSARSTLTIGIDPEAPHIARRRPPTSTRRSAGRGDRARSRPSPRCRPSGPLLVDRQREIIAAAGRIVVEGRDIGSVVAPRRRPEGLPDRVGGRTRPPPQRRERRR